MDNFENYDSDKRIDQLLIEYDEKVMNLPDIEYQPHLLISKVRKHYMEHIIKLLSMNYETNQRLLNKNIYLPSAIWRCAKNIEMSAAQTSMVVQLYRRNIVTVIKELKSDTEKGKLYRKLYECLHRPADNEKKLQTNLDSHCNCKCSCNQRNKRRRISDSLKNTFQKTKLNSTTKDFSCSDQNIIPVITQSQVEGASNVASYISTDVANHNTTNVSNIINKRTSETQNEQPDELMLQLEKIFQSEPNDDDLFESTLCDVLDTNIRDDNTKTVNDQFETVTITQNNVPVAVTDNNTRNEEHLVSSGGLLVNNKSDNNTQKKYDKENKRQGKWLCEEYFLKVKLFELLDQIRDSNRKKYERIKLLMLGLFGDDSDDEGLMSPLEETPEFILSCRERIAPWVVKLLTPYYVKGRIRGKSLFKALAKHLIRLIYQCSPYPYEYEVKSFVSDFMDSHQIIRCEADFKQFKINNI